MSVDERLVDLLLRAEELRDQGREVHAEELCQDWPELLPELRRLLHGTGAVEQLLQVPTVDQDADSTPAPSAFAAAPLRLPGYVIHRELGRGGMGVVYDAEQANPHRRVALKVIRPGLASHDLVKRFAREAHVLGRLHHPGIAQVHAAGVADDGQPYFAMELVHGLPLAEHARRHRLATAARLALVARVCDAVQHAHDRGREVAPEALERLRRYS
jgi:serine/threonine protein kinase